ncbi:hypothetical protein [Teredinibacter franksiae]|uniref:hypothetical protein n=1 Tax=Teredinibacter franksiae TaxID=2761453 RepID=UPI001623B8B6|nr:hypothetical protein [Teredinibacter franksiae]
MNTKILLIAFASTLLCTSFVLEFKQHGLEREILSANQQCESWLTQLQAQYAVQPARIVKAATTPRTITAPEKEDIKPAIDIEQLASYSHRVQAVSHKYEFLLLTAQLDADDKKLLRRLLVRRERLENTVILAEQNGSDIITELEYQLYEVEDQLQILIADPLDYQRYNFLRNKQL